MKRIGLFLLAVVMVTGLAGCSKDHDADPVGTWSAVIDWDGYDPFSGALHIYHDGTMITDNGTKATWSVDGDQIAINFSTAIYSGTVEDNDTIIGTMIGAGGRLGTWHADKINDKP